VVLVEQCSLHVLVETEVEVLPVAAAVVLALLQTVVEKLQEEVVLVDLLKVGEHLEPYGLAAVVEELQEPFVLVAAAAAVASEQIVVVKLLVEVVAEVVELLGPFLLAVAVVEEVLQEPYGPVVAVVGVGHLEQIFVLVAVAGIADQVEEQIVAVVEVEEVVGPVAAVEVVD